MRKYILNLILLCGLLGSAGLIKAEVVYTLDFSKEGDGDAKTWLESKGFSLKQDADDDDMILRFEKGKLVVGTVDDINGVIIKEIKIADAKRIRIEWGVNQYPDGADWEKGMLREAVGVIVSFGTKKIDSGSFVVPNVPYFITLFLGEKEQENKAYVGKYFKKGGRYICSPCQNPVEKTVITEFDLHKAFLGQFNEKSVPPVTGLAIEADTRDTNGKSMAFIKKIEFLSD